MGLPSRGGENRGASANPLGEAWIDPHTGATCYGDTYGEYSYNGRPIGFTSSRAAKHAFYKAVLERYGIVGISADLNIPLEQPEGTTAPAVAAEPEEPIQ